MKRVGTDWPYLTVCMKDQVLGNDFEGTFSDSFRQNLSLNPHCQDSLQSTSCPIWDFLPSFWGCLRSLWFEICVPNDKFGFSRIIVKLPVKFCSRSFEWLCLQIRSDTKYFSSLIQGLMWSRINICYSILFSNLKQKKNTTLLLIDLLAVT